MGTVDALATDDWDVVWRQEKAGDVAGARPASGPKIETFSSVVTTILFRRVHCETPTTDFRMLSDRNPAQEIFGTTWSRRRFRPLSALAIFLACLWGVVGISEPGRQSYRTFMKYVTGMVLVPVLVLHRTDLSLSPHSWSSTLVHRYLLGFPRVYSSTRTDVFVW